MVSRTKQADQEHREDKDTGTQGGEPGAKKINPRAISPQDTIIIFITVAACHASAPNMAKASGVTSRFFHSFFPSRHKHLACYMALTFFTSDLLDLIIIEISSDNYQYKETSSREVEQTGCQKPTGHGS